MSFNELACAVCGGPVSEGRCATCRASREMLRYRAPIVTRQLLLQLLLALAVLLGAVAFAVERTG
jgi:predicted nucleic acid-binding Zn ribbon protein